MEGGYSYLTTAENEIATPDVFTEKNAYRICSFSGEKALSNPAIWGYCANGFKGVAIEVEVVLPSRPTVGVRCLDSPLEWQANCLNS